ncbi:hypothetical protein TCAL_12059 [Tigriopus californicus]|uniref:C2H2-type domain-containing protein n=1 Tax=Tigriopus californicus TaxID=6832 RepID=A0A553NE46_TIGCA|nr:zinc finger protein 93-like [Tigriopus californicus]TRY63639.1 hypothetical protein TCAL_12059 [Tigriopus californicus]|eukprot:TCALIF_12059-PA protein Name:"Similar to ZNF629 Zinc finger protein 629 (Homo sapiens)" AED:0.58 eAED:0.58 QI:0/-1/0/1/-1/1/1/0/666
MEFAALLLERLNRPDRSLNLLHLVIQNWLVFQRSTFDYFDVDGDPYTSQVFLIETSTGRYIHRAQGQKIDFGATLDLDFLESKLIEVFQCTQACQGFPLADVFDNKETSKVLQYPYKRRVANGCQFYYNKQHSHAKTNHHISLSTCPPCLEVWQEIASQQVQFNLTDDPEARGSSSQNGSEEIALKFDNNEDQEDPFLDLQGDLGAAELSFGSEEEFDQKLLEPVLEHQDTQPDEQPPIWPVKRKRTRKRRNLESQDEEEEDVKDAKVPKTVYSCEHCPETFTCRRAFQRHRKRRTRNRRRVGCQDCDEKDIITFKQLIQHAQTSHPEKLEYYQQFVPPEEDKEAMKEPLTCFKCDMVNNSSFMIHRHKELYHQLGDYRCDDCQEACLTYYDLIIHNYQRHSKAVVHMEPNTFGLEMVTNPEGKIEVKRARLMCVLCGKPYGNDCGLFNHLRGVHSWGLFECKPCEESCHYAHEISSHMLNFHETDPQIKCPKCSAHFNLTEDAQVFNHHYKACRVPDHKQKEKMEGATSYQCHYCGKEYSCSQTLGYHVKLHEGIERFKCSYCDYGTNIKEVLIAHEKTHLRKKGLDNSDTDKVLYYQCDRCHKRYNFPRSLQTHIKRDHEGIKPCFPCPDCSESFNSKTVFYKHRRKEHGFVSGRLGKHRRPIL